MNRRTDRWMDQSINQLIEERKEKLIKLEYAQARKPREREGKAACKRRR